MVLIDYLHEQPIARRWLQYMHPYVGLVLGYVVQIKWQMPVWWEFLLYAIDDMALLKLKCLTNKNDTILYSNVIWGDILCRIRF